MALLGKEESKAWISSQSVSADGTLEIPSSIQGIYDSFSSPICFKDYPVGDQIVHLKILSENFFFPDYLFKNLKQLRTVTINGIHYGIPAECFRGCPRLQTVTVKKNNPIIISDGAFAECTELTTFIGNVKKVYLHSFDGCHSLQSFPFETVEELRAYAFARCTSLKKVKCEHPQGTRLMGPCFSHCANLEEFYLGGATAPINERETVWSGLFSNCPKLKTIYLSSFRSLTHFETISEENTLENLYILTPETKQPPLEYWKKQGKFLRDFYGDYRNVKVNGDLSILKVLNLPPGKIAPLSKVRLNAQGKFEDSYTPYKGNARSQALLYATMPHVPPTVGLLPREIMNEIFETDHYTFVDHPTL